MKRRDNSSNNGASGGVGFYGLLTILFIGLKLTGYITWSWLWVLSPTWVPLAIVLVILLFVGLGAIVMHFLE